tara:strand:+ start:1751 stop:2557 length:807 start_codon:yes stop_codon:yes gene_type:complete
MKIKRRTLKKKHTKKSATKKICALPGIMIPEPIGFEYENKEVNMNNNDLVNSLVSKGLLKPLSTEEFIFRKIDRLDFCESHIGCYVDRPIRILENQTMTAPHLHSYATTTLRDYLRPGTHVLDVGSGNGYLCAVFSYMVDIENTNGTVTGIDIYPKLIERSKENINKNHSQLFNTGRLKIILGDGWKGYPSENPNPIYDVIHVGACAENIPLNLWNQLKPGGRMFIPVKGNDGGEYINIIDKPIYIEKYGLINVRKTMNVRYVPLQKR